MSWVKDDEGQSHYRKVINNCCVLKIEAWEHGYYVAVTSIDAEDDETDIPLSYFYTFGDARSFLTSISRLVNQSGLHISKHPGDDNHDSDNLL